MKSLQCLILTFGLSLFACAVHAAENIHQTAFSQGHSHNDYLHGRPLLDAVENGFSSAEADVFLVDGDLLLGHDRSQVRPGRSLLTHYLKPLADLAAKGDGWIHEHGRSFHLLVDFKTDCTAAYELLQKQIEPYHSILTEFRDGTGHARAVTIILTSNRPLPLSQISAQAVRWVGCDGRVADLVKSPDRHLVPWISDNWGSHFSWRGEGPISEKEINKLRQMVKQAHESGQSIRFWAAPDHPESWAIQMSAGVDWINTDKLKEFAHFRSTHPAGTR